ALRVYLSSQALLFSRVDTGLETLSAASLIAAGALTAVSLARGRPMSVSLYLSTATIRRSLTVLLAGTYLLSVGVLAWLAQRLAPGRSLPLDAFLVFFALTALAVLMLSDRLRRRLRLF